MVSNKENILSALSEILKDNETDEAISLLEDVSDTLDDLSRKLDESGDWENKFHANDSMWRKKYRDRFSGLDPDSVQGNSLQDVSDEDADEKELKTFEDLFD